MAVAERDSPQIWLENLHDERQGVALYEGLAKAETDAKRAHAFNELAASEERHARIWQRKLESAGLEVPATPLTPRTRFLLWIARRFGPRAALPLVARNEAADIAKYARQGGDGAALVGEEQEHGATLRRLAGQGPLSESRLIAQRERWHRGGNGGALRAAVFGMNDGLVSNLSLVLGVAAAGAAPRTLVVTGLSGLCAGAFSMALGEYVSVASQRDLLRRQLQLEEREMTEAPEEEQAELEALLRDKGLSEDEARASAEQLMRNPAAALDTLVREELGLDPNELGSPFTAAGSSFAMFSIGALVPLVPVILLDGRAAVLTSAALGGVVLATAGAFLGFLAGTSPLRSGLRMLGLAALAATVTVAVGRLVGAQLG